MHACACVHAYNLACSWLCFQPGVCVCVCVCCVYVHCMCVRVCIVCVCVSVVCVCVCVCVRAHCLTQLCWLCPQPGVCGSSGSCWGSGLGLGAGFWHASQRWPPLPGGRIRHCWRYLCFYCKPFLCFGCSFCFQIPTHLVQSKAMSAFSPVGLWFSNSMSMCVWMCVCVCVCVWMCVCVCVSGMNMKYALHWHIHILVLSILCPCIHTSTHSQIHPHIIWEQRTEGAKSAYCPE